MAAKGSSGPLAQRGLASPDVGASGGSSEDGGLECPAAVPRLFQSLVPPSVVKWLRAEIGGGGFPYGSDAEGPANPHGAGEPPWMGARRGILHDDSEGDISSGINPLFPLEGTIDAQLSRLGGEAWEALRPPGRDEILLDSLGAFRDGEDRCILSGERGGTHLSLGESRALLQALLPLAAQKVSAAVAADRPQQLSIQQQLDFRSHQISGVFSLIPQPTGATVEGLEQWLTAPQKAGGPLACGPLLGGLRGMSSGIVSSLNPHSELQRRKQRRRRQALLRQLLKSHAMLLQLSQQAKGTQAAATSPEEAHQQQEVLRQRIRAELRRAAIAAYNLSCCCKEEGGEQRRALGASHPSEAVDVKGEAPRSPSQAGPAAAAAATQQQQQQKPAATAEEVNPASPELLLPLAALPWGIGGPLPATDGEWDEADGPSPPPPPSPVSWPTEDTAEEGAPRVGVSEETVQAAGVSPGTPSWLLDEITFDGRRSAFVVSLIQRGAPAVPPEEAADDPSGRKTGGPLRRIKVFSCLCRSRDKTAAVAARYGELRQRVGLSAEETAAAQILSDEGDTDGEEGSAAAASAAATGKGWSACRDKGITRLLEEVGEGLQLLQLRRQRLALQQQRRQLFSAASQGCWFAADTLVTSAPYPLSDPPWRHRLASVPPGVHEGPPDLAEEAHTPRCGGGLSAVAPGATKGGGAQRGKGHPKFGAPFPCGGPPAGGSFNPYMGGEEEDSSSIAGGRAGASSSNAAAAAEGDPTVPFSIPVGEVEELPFAGDPPDSKPWPRPPVSRAPYTCLSVECPIGGSSSAGQGEGAPDNPTPETESAEAPPWGEPPGEIPAEGPSSAIAAPPGEGLAADGGTAPGSTKLGDLTGPPRGGGVSGGTSWALRVTQRQKGDSWQLRMAAALLTRGFEELREEPSGDGERSSVDFLVLYDSPEHRDAALKVLHGLQPPVPTSFSVAVDSERRKELRQLYEFFLEPTFAVQADDKVVRIRDAVINIFSYPQLYIMLHCLLTWDMRLLCLSNFLVWVCGYSNDASSWLADPAEPEAVSYLLNLAHTFCDRLGAAGAETGARELPADDAALLQRNRLLLQLYMAQDQREATAPPCQGSASQDSAGMAGGGTAATTSPAATLSNSIARLPGTAAGAPLTSPPIGAPGTGGSAAAGGYKEEVLQVAGVGPVDFTLPDGVKFDKSKLAFRCLWREGCGPIRQQQQQQQQQQGMASPKTPAAAGPPRWPGAPTPMGSLLKSQSSQQQNRSRTFSCRKYGLYQSKLLAMQARLASELLMPQPPATTRNRIPALPAIVFGLLPLPEPVESPQQAVEGLPLAEGDRQSRRAKWQQLLQQGGWKGGCPDAAFAEAAADAVETLVGDGNGHSRPSSKRKRHSGAPPKASSVQQQLQQQQEAAQAAALRSSRPSEDSALLSLSGDPALAGNAWASALRPGVAPQTPLDSPAAWVLQAGDGADGRVLQQQALSSRPLLACVWEHAACRWRVTLAGPEEGGRGGEGGITLGRTCFFFSPSEPTKKKAALLLARRWTACQLLMGERLCVLAGPMPGTETALEFLQSCPGLWTGEDEADVNALALMGPQQLRSIAVSCESEGAAGFAAAAPETGLNTGPNTPNSAFDCSSALGAAPGRINTEGGPPLQLSAEAVAAAGNWGEWQSPQNAVGSPFTPMGGPWGPLGDGGLGEGAAPAKKSKSRSRPTRQGAPMDEAATERLRSQKAAAARVRWMRYRMQQEAEAQQLTAALAATLTDRPHMPDSNGLNPVTAIFPM